MSVSKLAAGLIALALGAAVVTAVAGVGPEVKAVTGVGPEVKAEFTPPAAKADRSATRPVNTPPLGSACPREPWPYGCQWREPPARRVLRSSRPL